MHSIGQKRLHLVYLVFLSNAGIYQREGTDALCPEADRFSGPLRWAALVPLW